MLLATAFVAILLSIYVNRFQRGRRFVTAIEERDGAVTYPFEYEYSDGWLKWLSGWLGEAAVFPIESVSISGIDDDDLLIFRDAQGLQSLEITDAKITRVGISRLALLKDLHRLTLESDSVTVRDLEPLARIPRVEASRNHS